MPGTHHYKKRKRAELRKQNCCSCPDFTSRLLTPPANRKAAGQRLALSCGTKMTRLLQCWAGKPNTVLLFIAGPFTPCMTARVESHDSRNMGAHTHTHSHAHVRSSPTHGSASTYAGDGEGMRSCIEWALTRCVPVTWLALARTGSRWLRLARNHMLIGPARASV